jgi:hypothetical protein
MASDPRDPLTLDERAKALYERNAPVAPKWEQLGEITKEVWREEVLLRQSKEPT